MIQHTTAETEAGERFDRLLSRALNCSVNAARRLIESGVATLDGRRAAPGVRVTVGQTLRSPPPPDREALAPVAEDLPLHVLFESAALVVVDKPAGIPCATLAPKERGTLANRIAARWPDAVAAGDDAREAGLVHRLDNDTSGLLLVARRRDTWLALTTFLRQEKIAKRYLALVEGTALPDGERTIDHPLAHSGPKMRTVPMGLSATTHYRVLARGEGVSLCEARLHVGRHHQVRVHFASIGHPLVGDTLYGATLTGTRPGHFLHAAGLTLPPNDIVKQLDFTAPPPAEWRETLAHFSLDGRELGLE